MELPHEKQLGVGWHLQLSVCSSGLGFRLAPEVPGVPHLAQAAAQRCDQCPGPWPTPQPEAGPGGRTETLEPRLILSCEDLPLSRQSRTLQKRMPKSRASMLITSCVISRDLGHQAMSLSPPDPGSGCLAHSGQGAPLQGSLPHTHITHGKHPCRHLVLTSTLQEIPLCWTNNRGPGQGGGQAARGHFYLPKLAHSDASKHPRPQTFPTHLCVPLGTTTLTPLHPGPP